MRHHRRPTPSAGGKRLAVGTELNSSLPAHRPPYKLRQNQGQKPSPPLPFLPLHPVGVERVGVRRGILQRLLDTSDGVGIVGTSAFQDDEKRRAAPSRHRLAV